MKDDNIRTPEQLRQKFERLYRRTLSLDPHKVGDWPAILKWAEGYEYDLAVRDALFLARYAQEYEYKVLSAMVKLYNELCSLEPPVALDTIVQKVVAITLYGGGPAGGIDFRYNEYGDLVEAQMWHTESNSNPVYLELCKEDSEVLADYYCVADYIGED